MTLEDLEEDRRHTSERKVGEYKKFHMLTEELAFDVGGQSAPRSWTEHPIFKEIMEMHDPPKFDLIEAIRGGGYLDRHPWVLLAMLHELVEDRPEVPEQWRGKVSWLVWNWKRWFNTAQRTGAGG